MSDDIPIPKPLLQLLFDTAVGSMDFGSGFLGDEEVAALRQTAELLGVDPMEGTPHEYRKRFAHPFQPYDSPYASSRENCRLCNQKSDVEVHS